jgi:hypothetical protein
VNSGNLRSSGKVIENTANWESPIFILALWKKIQGMRAERRPTMQAESELMFMWRGHSGGLTMRELLNCDVQEAAHGSD